MTIRMRTLSALLLTPMLSIPAFAKDIQVSPGQSIKHAVERASSGDVVHVAPGIYDETLEIGKSGIRVVSDTKWGAKIWPSSEVKGHIVEISGNNVTFEGFDLGPNGSAYITNGVDVHGNNCKLVNNKIHDINTTGSATGSAVGVAGTGNLISGNVIYHVGNDEFDHGIYAYAGSENVIENNIVSDASGFGIHLWHTPHHITITGNTVFYNGLGGITVGNGEHGTTAYGVIVENNTTYGNGEAGGIQEAGDVSRNKYINNKVLDGIRLKNGIEFGTITGSARFSLTLSMSVEEAQVLLDRVDVMAVTRGTAAPGAGAKLPDAIDPVATPSLPKNINEKASDLPRLPFSKER